jgi:magnesium chelatase family protein
LVCQEFLVEEHKKGCHVLSIYSVSFCQGWPMIATIHSSAVLGIDAVPVAVEVDISFGLPVFNMVGLAEAAVRESKERVRAAIQNSGYTFPMDRVVVNLAPADMKKQGTALDLPVALGILTASGLLSPQATAKWLLAGELSLDGRLKPVRAALPFALAAKQAGFAGIILPGDNGQEAALVSGVKVMALSSLSQVVSFLTGNLDTEPVSASPDAPRPAPVGRGLPDFSQVRGQAHVKRALEISAAGFHHLLMSGPPGSGKSMMAKRLPGILPLPSLDEAMEIARIYSIGAEPGKVLETFGVRPFRSPHHSISDAGLVGGGPRPLPGEISMAHNGVLFLDELPEFRRNVLEVLRQPLEEGTITIARAGAKASFPCRFMLVAAMNPCACGNLGSPSRDCTCTLARIRQYRSKISGPLMDRMDLQVEVPQVPYDDLAAAEDAESSAVIRDRVAAARQIQGARFKDVNIFSNAAMGPDQIKAFCHLDKQTITRLKQLMARFRFSARAYTSLLKVARTIADLSGQKQILEYHVLEAAQYKALERDKDA